MCVSECLEVVRSQLDRRAFLAGVGAGLPALGLGKADLESRKREAPVREAARFPSFERVVDLTYTYSDRFPHFAGRRSVVRKEVNSSTDSGDPWNVYTWTLDEHAGTHIDAPFHRNAGGHTVDALPVRDLVLPLAVIDIADKSRSDHAAVVTPDDVLNWERLHGRLPQRCCVAMNSGWGQKAFTDQFINLDRIGVRQFPGFGIEAAELLFHERQVVALATDTASLDHGPSAEFPTHVLWLGGNRFGLENVAALDQVPATGATLVAGAPKIKGATGGHTRVLALV